MLRVGCLYDDDDLRLIHASVDGLVAFDKIHQRTQVATPVQRQHLEDTLAWLSRLGFSDTHTNPPPAVIITYSLFAAAIIYPQNPRSHEIMGERPERLAAKMIAAADTVTQPMGSAKPIPAPTLWISRCHRAVQIACIAGVFVAVGAATVAFMWESGRGYAVEGLLTGQRSYSGLGDIFARLLRSAFWNGLIIGGSAGVALVFWRQIVRASMWVWHGR